MMPSMMACYVYVVRFVTVPSSHRRGADAWEQKAVALTTAVHAVFRDEDRDADAAAWFDYDLARRRLRKRFHPSNVFPLLLMPSSGQAPPHEWPPCADCCAKAVVYLRRSGALTFRGMPICPCPCKGINIR